MAVKDFIDYKNRPVFNQNIVFPIIVNHYQEKIK